MGWPAWLYPQAQEEAEIARFDRQNDRWFDLSARTARLEAINEPLMDLIANVGTVFIIWYGGLLVIRDPTDAGRAGGLFDLRGSACPARASPGRHHLGLMQAAAAGEPHL
jgi:ABC-type multidrug transport system fused ATPase/permease subunit